MTKYTSEKNLAGAFLSVRNLARSEDEQVFVEVRGTLGRSQVAISAETLAQIGELILQESENG